MFVALIYVVIYIAAMLIAWILAKILGNWLFWYCCSNCLLRLAIWKLSRRQIGSAKSGKLGTLHCILNIYIECGLRTSAFDIWKTWYIWFLSLYGKIQYSCLVRLLSTYVNQRERRQSKDSAVFPIHFLHILGKLEAGKFDIFIFLKGLVRNLGVHTTFILICLRVRKQK